MQTDKLLWPKPADIFETTHIRSSILFKDIGGFATAWGSDWTKWVNFRQHEWQTRTNIFCCRCLWWSEPSILETQKPGATVYQISGNQSRGNDVTHTQTHNWKRSLSCAKWTNDTNKLIQTNTLNNKLTSMFRNQLSTMLVKRLPTGINADTLSAFIQRSRF